MSYHCSWVAVREMSLGEVLVDLELGVTGERSDQPMPGLSAIETLDDWVVVLGFGADAIGDVEEANARALSYDGWTLFFRCDDTKQTNELIEYRDGVKTWALSHSPDTGVVISGDLDEAIKERIEDARDHDLPAYEIPTRIGRILTGFRHDQPVGDDDDEPFLELESR
jgi:hypothetical protein